MCTIRKSIIGSPAGLLALMVALAAVLLSGHAVALDIPPLGVISSATVDTNPALVTQRSALQAERNELRTRTQAHNSVCNEISERDPKLASCTQELQTLTQDVERHIDASKRFNAALATASAMAIRASHASDFSDTSVVDLSDTNLADANKALMRHQWSMSIDQRYKDDPAVQLYIRDLWDSAANNNAESLNKIKSILADQLRVSGLTQQQVDDFFRSFDTFTTGKGRVPKEWNKTSKFAREIDGAAQKNVPQNLSYGKLVKTLGKTESIKTKVTYMGTGPQTAEDCVLHAISDGAQIPFVQVKAKLSPTLKNLAIARSEVRKNPELDITSQKNGGTGGLNSFEEMLIARQVGEVIAVPDKNFAKAIESTHSPVITAVGIIGYDQNNELKVVGAHEVAVTGVHRTKDGKVYYSVMDSNLKNYPNYTAYVEKNDFENHLLFGGGYVVVPNEKH